MLKRGAVLPICLQPPIAYAHGSMLFVISVNSGSSDHQSTGLRSSHWVSHLTELADGGLHAQIRLSLAGVSSADQQLLLNHAGMASNSAVQAPGWPLVVPVISLTQEEAAAGPEGPGNLTCCVVGPGLLGAYAGGQGAPYCAPSRQA